jgi:hypothetical protein
MRRAMDLLDLGMGLTLLASVLLGLSLLSSSYMQGPLVQGRYFFPVVSDSGSQIWLSTGDMIRTNPAPWVSAFVAFLTVWLMGSFTHSGRRALLLWTPWLLVVVLPGLSISLTYEGFNFLFYHDWLGSGFWLFLAALLCAGAGSILLAAAPVRPAARR